MLNANQRLALEHGLLHQRVAAAEEERDRLRERVAELEKEREDTEKKPPSR